MILPIKSLFSFLNVVFWLFQKNFSISLVTENRFLLNVSSTEENQSHLNAEIPKKSELPLSRSLSADMKTRAELRCEK
ncbi:hypothetical protein LEP1GSC191_0675 [Leptospira borgpetersenii serovar Mini str. 201000851]|uniref:Uncharacterized protein n=3 Tax=Leptospira borgpetersenii TaxID=174 RepID=M3HTP8_LEPBO|nr:hypothetical protein LEP1GSC128_4250 [Leptospira borgpetersenii str. 200801926]EMG01426.1 hypothetical protein LEP1GSC123_3837 [Leptospira borgpetersenii str. 200701203]EMK11434.1 hypothetical protein LEP1GSC066_1737 [Leptospira sp. serovar Kenya str. Sh9]EMN18228.1 hypothetical protein LEP1GSC056_1660 [Leptospira borgpetersenii str. Brem 328]ENO64513.1 hypothetical protein LEP1GSC191_0675 [Leptospira borgpetersenii serovar Mini str. 201000851]